ncbi:hypothetical protein [Streptomyces chryseus]|nr:hypothetical protein [Streptomyces chryseus]
MDRRHYIWYDHADTATLPNDRGHTIVGALRARLMEGDGMRKQLASLALVTGAMVATTLGTSVEVQAQEPVLCPSNAICLWTGKYHTGTRYVWTGGHRDLPSNFTDHVGSCRANRNGAFIDWATGKVCRPVSRGDYADFYLRGFGGKMDAVGDN